MSDLTPEQIARQEWIESDAAKDIDFRDWYIPRLQEQIAALEKESDDEIILPIGGTSKYECPHCKELQEQVAKWRNSYYQRGDDILRMREDHEAQVAALELGLNGIYKLIPDYTNPEKFVREVRLIAKAALEDKT